ncbi:MAG TPA: sigma-70 family RNA polymerase sigma factor [Aequorivita sp.]|nr:sigma-70 family RNA polymerase sigma factor [Aequorivita sp.]
MQNKKHKLNDLSSENLVVLIKNNDSAVLKQLYGSNYIKVRRYVLRNNGDEQQAKDVYQEAFLAMWRNVKDDKFTEDSKGNIGGYLFQIAKYKWLDHLRSKEYKNTTFINRDIEFEESQSDEEESKRIKIKMIMTAVGQLGEKCQTLLKLFYFERKSYKEISKIVGMDEASARNAKYRCQEELKKLTQIIPNEYKE